VGSSFCDFCVFFAIHKDKFPQNKITAIFSAKIYSTVEIIQKYWFEGENARDDSVDNTSSGTLVIVNPL